MFTVFTAGYPEENGVIVLNDENIHKALTEFRYLLIEFYAPWCSHCRAFQAEYDNASAALKKHNANVTLAKINGDLEREASKHFGVEAFPTLKFFSNGNVKDFRGSRTQAGVLQFLLNNVPYRWFLFPLMILVAYVLEGISLEH